MTDLWQDDADVSAFELPGDAARLAALAEPPTEETPAEEAVDEQGQPRNEKGQFAPKEPPVEEVPSEEPPVEQAPAEQPTLADDQIVRLLTKYGVDEEGVRSALEVPGVRKALEASAEAQQTIGSMEGELGTLREQAARAQQLEQYLWQLQNQAQAPATGDWETLLDERPHEAAQQAYAYGKQTNDWRYWQEAARAWDEVSPGASTLWHQNQQLLAEHQRMSQLVQNQVLGQQVQDVAEEFGGLQALSERIGEIAPQFPTLMRLLADPNTPPETQAEVLKTLELIRRGLDTGTLAQQAQETARKLAQDEQRAADEAAVVTATRTNPQQPKSVAEQIASEWYDDEARWNEGWNIS